MKTIKQDKNSSSRLRQMPKVSWRVYLAERIFLKAAQPVRRFADILEQVSQAIIIGLLGKQALSEYMEKSYQDYINFYNPRHYQLDCEEKVLPLLTKYHSQGKLLNPFCGQGREAQFFADNGFDVTGIDSSKAMIDRAVIYAKEAGFKSSFEVAYFSQYTTKSYYDVIYTSPWMYGTFPDPADRLNLLKQCTSLLTPEGVLVISYIRMLHPEQLREKILHWIALATSSLTVSDWRPKFGDRLYRKIFHHFFIPGEIGSEIETAGFKIVAQQESDNGLFNFCILALDDKSQKKLSEKVQI